MRAHPIGSDPRQPGRKAASGRLSTYSLFLFCSDAKSKPALNTFQRSHNRASHWPSLPAHRVVSPPRERPCLSRGENRALICGPCPLMPGFHNRRFFGCNAAFGRRSDLWSLNVDLISRWLPERIRNYLPGSSLLVEPHGTVRWSHASLLRQFPFAPTAASPLVCGVSQTALWQRTTSCGHPAP